MVVFICQKKISTNWIIEMEFCIKANPKKFIMYLYSIWHHIINHLEKFYVKNPLVRGEIKQRNLSWDRLDQLKYFEEVN